MATTTKQVERVYRLMVDGTQAVKSLNNIEKSTKNINSQLGSVGKLMKAAFAYVGIRTVVNDFNNIADAADRIGKTASKVGLTAESLQELQYAAQLSGVETNTLDMAMQRFSRRVGEAANGSGELASTFNRLGIDLKLSNGVMRDTDDILNDYADAIKGAASSQEQLRLAFKGFDSEGAALVNMLRDGSDGLDKFRDAAQQAGVVIGGEVIRNSEEFNDVMTKFSRQMTVLRSVLYRDLVPAITKIIEQITEIVPRIRSWVSEQTILNSSLAIFSGTIRIAWQGLSAFGKIFVAVGKVIGELAAGASILEANKNFDALTDSLYENGQSIKDIWNELKETLQGGITIEITNGLQVEEATDGVQKVASAWDKLKEGVQRAVDASREAGDIMVRVGEQFANSFADGIADMVAKGKANFKELANSIIADITRMIVKQQILNALGSTFGTTTATSSNFFGGQTFANGGAFRSSLGYPYGVYNSPQFFNFGGGPLKAFAQGGVFAEAGPEAIMPLARDSQGRLGVEATGSGTVVNVINNTSATANVSEERRLDGTREINVMIENAMGATIASGRLDKTFGANFGLRRRGY